MEAKHKYSLEHPSMFPTAAIVDPELTESLPAYQTATSGIDALTQAIEAYWSRAAQPVSDIYALEAVRTIFDSLEAACQGDAPGARVKMAQGSLLSGLAFSNTKTTVCHSLSYPMSAHFNVAHGQAVSITLAPFLVWNADAIAAKMPPLLDAMGVTHVDDAAERITRLIAAIGLATDLRSLGIREKDVDLILREGFTVGRADNNPKPVAEADARAVLRSIL